jgi:hypothetical protein
MMPYDERTPVPREMLCHYCANIFFATRANQKYCAKNCARIVKNIQRRKPCSVQKRKLTLKERRNRHNAYDQSHREERRNKAKQRRLNNPDTYDTWQRSPKGRAAARRAQKKKYYADLELSRAKGRAAKKLFASRHPIKIRLSNQKRSLRKKNLPYTFTEEQYKFMMQYWSFSCAVCGNQEGFQWKLVGDHWIPLSDPYCPGTIAENMVPLCHGKGGCNNSKVGKPVYEWLLSRYSRQRVSSIKTKVSAYFEIVKKQFSQTTIETCNRNVF